MKRVLGWAVVVLMGALASAGQEIKAPPSWDKLAATADEVVNVNMDRRMLRFAAKFMDDEGDAEGKRLVSKLNGIYVRSLQFKKTGAFTDADVAPIRAQLEGPEWSHMVEVESKTEKERVEVYVKTVGEQTTGMVILAQEPTELTLVYLDGPIDPRDLDDLSGNFGIPKDIHMKAGKTGKPQAAKPAGSRMMK